MLKAKGKHKSDPFSILHFRFSIFHFPTSSNKRTFPSIQSGSMRRRKKGEGENAFDYISYKVNSYLELRGQSEQDFFFFFFFSTHPIPLFPSFPFHFHFHVCIRVENFPSFDWIFRSIGFFGDIFPQNDLFISPIICNEFNQILDIHSLSISHYFHSFISSLFN